MNPQATNGRDADRPCNHSQPPASRKRRCDRGFTLLELLVVLVILGLLAALAGPRVLGYLSGARSDAARVQVEGFSTALEFYLLDNQAYPTTAQGLDALINQPATAERWDGPYLNGTSVPVDPWGSAYVYRAPGSDGRPYDLLSLGSDGAVGGEGEETDIDASDQ